MARVKQCCFNFCNDFKEFATRGSVLDLAIGIVIGTAFTNVVQSLVDDIITPPLGLVLGGVDFANLTVKMNNFVYKDQPPVVIRYGKFIQSIITLLIVAFALFFIIKAANQLYKIAARKKEKKKIDSNIEASEEVKVLREIRDLLARQSFVEPITVRLFTLRGNVIDLAIDIIIGTVFINIVQVFADDIVTRPLGLVLGDVDFANLTIKMENLFKQ